MEPEEERQHKPTARRIVEKALEGESFTFHARDYASRDFIDIAAACAQGGGHLTITEAKRLARPVRDEIEAAGGSHVTLQL